jgi:ribosomal protein L7/L12
MDLFKNIRFNAGSESFETSSFELSHNGVTLHEYEVAWFEGKIPAIKEYHARTGRGLAEAKKAIEEAPGIVFAKY